MERGRGAWRGRDSGERSFTATARPAVIHAALARYRFAVPLCTGKRVLDIGCGTGTGHRLLAETARYCVGLDYSSETLVFLAPSFRQWRIRAVAGDALALPFQVGNFDVVTAFEVIEHLHDPSLLLGEMKRVLAPGGMAILSTPNRPVYSPRGTWLDYHVREYDAAELKALLAPFFTGVTLLGQAQRTRDALLDCNPLNRFFYPLKRLIDPRGVVLNRLRAAYVYFRWGERPDDCSPDDFPVLDRDVESLPILVAVCRTEPLATGMRGGRDAPPQ
jgi:SAM-dependent methyltransferase